MYQNVQNTSEQCERIAEAIPKSFDSAFPRSPSGVLSSSRHDGIMVVEAIIVVDDVVVAVHISLWHSRPSTTLPQQQWLPFGGGVIEACRRSGRGRDHAVVVGGGGGGERRRSVAAVIALLSLIVIVVLP